MIIPQSTKSPFSPYIPEQMEVKFLGRSIILGSENPVECKVNKINIDY